jgi:(p)ppGpp synthase/HD superfamily hydrolase
MSAKLEDAIILAVQAHRGQVDRGGQPYVLHLLRVMLRQTETAGRIVAVLHDALEDTHLTLSHLKQSGFDDEVCQAVDCLTRRRDEKYEDGIDRIAENPLARRVKLADLEDNMDVRRLSSLDDKSLHRLARYKAAWDKLRAAGET